VFTEAERLGYGRYFLDGAKAVEDNHIPLLELGVPAVDIIDLDYGSLNLYWHTRADTVDKCSPTSLGLVGTVTLYAVAAVESK
jgi:glutaminyl-peptide cyclotransferase